MSVPMGIFPGSYQALPVAVSTALPGVQVAEQRSKTQAEACTQRAYVEAGCATCFSSSDEDLTYGASPQILVCISDNARTCRKET